MGLRFTATTTLLITAELRCERVVDWKKHTRTGMKAAGVMGAINLLILGFMMVIGYDTTPLDPSGVEISIPFFAIATVMGGGIVPGLIGTVVWTKIDGRWSEQSRNMFTLLALAIATLSTLPFTNQRAPTGDAYVLTSVLHYSTAILGSCVHTVLRKRGVSHTIRVNWTTGVRYAHNSVDIVLGLSS